MWILFLVWFNAPMQISKMDVLEIHYSEERCVKRVQEAKSIGIPENANVGCVFLREISKA
jgi:hypothetical protein|tara:strand:+ start:1009 stop:1188 length:180 start_codon:yes stop_codon:yes gene_type:complete